MPAWTRRRASHQSVVDSSARAATADSMRSFKWVLDSPSSARRGWPKVSRVWAGLGYFMPLPRILPVPSMWTGTTGTPHRSAR